MASDFQETFHFCFEPQLHGVTQLRGVYRALTMGKLSIWCCTRYCFIFTAFRRRYDPTSPFTYKDTEMMGTQTCP